MKILIVHDWIDLIVGAEKVFLEIASIFPNAELYTTVSYKKEFALIGGRSLKTHWINLLPFSKFYFRFLIGLFPEFFCQVNTKNYTLIISSNHAFIKGIKVPNEIPHISYFNAYMHYIWENSDNYFPSKLMFLLNPFIKRLQTWDKKVSLNPTQVIANSMAMKDMIKTRYGRECEVIYPPVDLEQFTLQITKEDYYLFVGRCVPVKRVDLLIETFKMLNARLIVVGDGPERKKLQSFASSNVQFVGEKNKSEVARLMQRAKCLIFPSIEAFGITSVEAQACGTPVIAINSGGVIETILDKETGIFFNSQTKEALVEAIQSFESLTFDSRKIHIHAQKFSKENFRNNFKSLVGKFIALDT
jgi:glycosyltransferase involved in cell wall biosynthesis